MQQDAFATTSDLWTAVKKHIGRQLRNCCSAAAVLAAACSEDLGVVKCKLHTQLASRRGRGVKSWVAEVQVLPGHNT